MKLKGAVASIIADGLDATAIFLDSFKLPVLRKKQRHMVKYTQQLANEYRTVFAEKPSKRVARVKQIKGSTVVLDGMGDIETGFDKKRRRNKRA